jgi:hypothetical protein
VEVYVADKGTPSWHSSKFYGNHPDKRPAAQTSRTTEPAKEPDKGVAIHIWFLRTIGVATIIGGITIMTTLFFWPGVAMVWFGIGALIWEVCVDPILIARPWRVQVLLIGVCLFLLAGTAIDGITWNEHLTDFRFVAFNASHLYFHDVDLWIYPGEWSMNAAIVDGPKTCELGVNEAAETFKAGRLEQSGQDKVTVTPTGKGMDIHDDFGTQYNLIAAKGYRLTCPSMPPESSVKIVFALASFDEKVISSAPMKPMTYTGQVLPGGNLSNHFKPRPIPKFAFVEKNYVRNYKPFLVKETMPVASGD